MHEPVTIFIICLTVFVSLRGFVDPSFMERLLFSPQPVLRDKQGYRLITSGFLHADWPHLIFNMYSLYSFGGYIEWGYSPLTLAIIYFSSILGGNLLSLWLHRHHIYRSLGASGGVCGVIFASIFLTGGGVRMFPLPLYLPAWLYAILFLLGSFYGIKRARDNVGHDAHLGGAIIGLVVTTFLHPHIVFARPYLYCAVMVLSLVLLFYLIRNPMFLPLSSFATYIPGRRSPPKRPLTPAEQVRQINGILDKISKSGMDSLTAAEHRQLLEASRSRGGNKRSDE